MNQGKYPTDKAADVHKSSTAHLVLLWLAFFACPALASIGVESAPDIHAVVYYSGGESGGGEVSSIVAGMEETPNVVVYRVALSPGAEIASLRRPIHLAFNDQGGIAVLYPDIGEPYRSVFSHIIDGIEDKTKTRVASYAIGATPNSQDLAAELRRQNIRVVIALGRNGLKAAANLDRDIGVVVGGVLSVPESETRGMSVFSLAPDPFLLFERLKVLMPSIRRVFVVYDPHQNAWLIRLAREAARSLGLELVAKEATDLKTAVRLYQEHLNGADPKRDAFWLPQDSVTVDESSVLPMVLQESWNRSLVVFSSSVAHVKRGALFSLYPNNMGLGRNLAGSALDRIASGGVPSRVVTPLREVLMAVNVRTASHLGLGIGPRQQQTFDMVFPEP